MTAQRRRTNHPAHLRVLAVAPGAVVLVLMAAGWTAHTLAGVRAVWAAAACVPGAAVVLCFSWRWAVALAGELRTQQHEERAAVWGVVYEWVARWRKMVDEGRGGVAWMREEIDRGGYPAAPGVRPAEQPTGEAVRDFDQALQVCLWEAWEALACAAAKQQQAARVPQEAFVTIARRLHALVTRGLASLDGLEREVEDPDLLDGLFKVDHLITQTRRQVESIAVLGGEVPRRIRNPVPLATVLRQTAAEIEHYTRVRVHPPRDETAVPGHAAAGVIHLLAELVENATKFAPHHTHVTLRADAVSAGLAIEIEDRGLHMRPDQVRQLNQLLATPDAVDVPEQLRDGRLGLLVVSLLAQRYGITVQLRRNILGGTLALVVLPPGLVTRPVKAPAEPRPAVLPQAGGRLPREVTPPTGGEPWPAATADHAAPVEPSPRLALPTAQPAAPQSDRPGLPRRTAVQPAAASRPNDVDSPTVPPPANTGLMARYAEGVRRDPGHGADPPDGQTG